MDKLLKAMEIEKIYQENRLNGKEPFHLFDEIKICGYETLEEYFSEKCEYLFSQWIPNINYINVAEVATITENAILNGNHGIFIVKDGGVYAYHGSDIIDYELCKNLGVHVVELNYEGGTIIGSENDLSLMMVMPVSIFMNNNIIMNKFKEIIEKYIEGISIDGNDLLVNGEKVMGSMTRNVGNTFVWAAQISFSDYSDIIAKVCNKHSVKKPAYIDNNKLTRDILESEVVRWLSKQ